MDPGLDSDEPITIEEILEETIDVWPPAWPQPPVASVGYGANPHES